MQQLPLQLQPKEGCTFDSYFPTANQLIVDVLRRMPSSEGESQVLIWGAQGLGKSHLLQALCHQAGKLQKTISYLPLAELMSADVELLEGIEHLDLVAIDDVQVISGHENWEQAIFNLINRCRLSGTRLLFAADNNPKELDLRLADLVSRLTWGPVFSLAAMDDSQKIQALKYRAQKRGLELADNVISYLMQHFPRDLFALFEYLDTLDKASLAQQRRITIPFVKSVLNNDY